MVENIPFILQEKEGRNVDLSMGITVTSMHGGPDFEDDDDHDMNDHDMHFGGGLSLTGHSFGQQHWYLQAFSPCSCFM